MNDDNASLTLSCLYPFPQVPFMSSPRFWHFTRSRDAVPNVSVRLSLRWIPLRRQKDADWSWTIDLIGCSILAAICNWISSNLSEWKVDVPRTMTLVLWSFYFLYYEAFYYRSTVSWDSRQLLFLISWRNGNAWQQASHFKHFTVLLLVFEQSRTTVSQTDK